MTADAKMLLCAVACAVKSISPTTEELMSIIGGRVEVIDCTGTEKVEDMIDALKSKKARLLANHGVLAAGKNVGETMVVAEAVEKAAVTYAIASFFGGAGKIDKRKIDKKH